jgi:hypothetical protein
MSRIVPHIALFAVVVSQPLFVTTPGFMGPAA